ncbi:thiamine biosynthesis lipoprotein ApbE [Neisseria flavescens]|nr:thiamine biosynthesis lipoprotein ApbE [Neisseria flavescens]
MLFLSNSFYRPIIGCTVAIVSALTLSACQPEKQQTITLQGETMGTTYTVKYLSDGQDKLPSPPKYKNALMTRLKKSTGKCLPTRPIPKSANSTSCAPSIRPCPFPKTLPM